MRVEFKVKRDVSGYRTVTPWVEGVSLAARISDYEDARGFEPAGGYEGLVPGGFESGPLDAYFLGGGPPVTPDGRLAVLACGCGELTCWPLACRIDAEPETVTWTAFCQPHHPERDYAGFGPFTFARADYEAAVRAMVEALA